MVWLAPDGRKGLLGGWLVSGRAQRHRNVDYRKETTTRNFHASSVAKYQYR